MLFIARDKRAVLRPPPSQPPAAPTRDRRKRYECNLYFYALMDDFLAVAPGDPHTRNVWQKVPSLWPRRKGKRDKPSSTDPRAVLRETMTMGDWDKRLLGIFRGYRDKFADNSKRSVA